MLKARTGQEMRCVVSRRTSSEMSRKSSRPSGSGLNCRLRWLRYTFSKRQLSRPQRTVHEESAAEKWKWKSISPGSPF